MPRQSARYHNLEHMTAERDVVSWYWRFLALASSWMILGGYLILPAAYTKDPDLRFSRGVLSIVIVTIMTTGYSFTALLCFACRNWMFQAESVFLPALASSALGLLTVLWSFASSHRFIWNTAAIVTTALAAFSAFLYGVLLLITNRKIQRYRRSIPPPQLTYTDTAYKNWMANMHPSALQSSETEEDQVHTQMQRLLKRKQESAPSPEASRSTFRIALPGDHSNEMTGRDQSLQESSRYLTPDLQHPRPPHRTTTWDRMTNVIAGGRGRSGSGTAAGSRGRDTSRTGSNGPRAVSREERRVEIEMGQMGRNGSANAP